MADMKIDFKALKMMELRSSPGEVIDRVAQDGEAFLIERNGQSRACLVPVSYFLPDIDPERITQELTKLHDKDEKYKLMINEHKELEVNFDEMAASEKVIISIVLPHGYPNFTPRVHVDPLPSNTPKRWRDGSLSIFGVMATWNSKNHDVVYTLGLARKWLRQYAKWRKNGIWPEEHESVS